MNTLKNYRRLITSILGVLCLIATVASSAPVTRSQTSEATNDVSVRLSEDHDTLRVGQEIAYTAIATNLGPDNATFVDIEFKLPGELKIVSISCDQGVSADGAFCEYSSLPAGSAVVSVLVATPDIITRLHSAFLRTSASALFENTGVIDPNLSNNTASVRTRLLVRPSHP